MVFITISALNFFWFFKLWIHKNRHAENILTIVWKHIGNAFKLTQMANEMIKNRHWFKYGKTLIFNGSHIIFFGGGGITIIEYNSQ